MLHSVPAARAQLRPFSRWMLVVIGLAVLFPAVAMQPAEASAATRSCTGWTSTTTPPKTIRVGRNNGRGPVEKVDFRRYVGIVMAKEWPPYLPQAAIEAGAVAVKQYAWFHAMAGHHRRGFTADGQCYDVVDSTRDQIYKPHKVSGVHGKIWRAVDATWGLSVRRAGQFFMTGYRSGTVRRCGASADGWRLFAKGVIACARQGLSREAIQKRYYGPALRLVWSDGSSKGWSASSSVGDDPAGKQATHKKSPAKAAARHEPAPATRSESRGRAETLAPASHASSGRSTAPAPVVVEMQRARKVVPRWSATGLQPL